MEENNINWSNAYFNFLERSEIKNSNVFKTLNENNIDTNELTDTPKQTQAGVIELNYKDKEIQKLDALDYVESVLSFGKDLAKDTVYSLTKAAINGIDVGINLMPLMVKMMAYSNPVTYDLYQKRDVDGFVNEFSNSVRDLSKSIGKARASLDKDMEQDNMVTKLVGTMLQDVPYAIPIHKKLKSMGLPTYVSTPLSLGLSTGISYSDDAQIFLNSEQVQGFKDMVGVLPNTSEEKIYNTTYRMLEGTFLASLTIPVVKALKFSKQNIPAFTNPQATISVGGAAAAPAAAEKNLEEKDKGLDYSVDIEPTTDAQIDSIYGAGASEKAMDEVLLPKTDEEIDEAFGAGASEKAMDEALLLNK